MSDPNALPPPIDPADEHFTRRVREFTNSAVFERLFKDGMRLVEEAAGFLDGPGRSAAKDMSRAGALAYAGESMRLTTRLMQLASWLMVQRAVRDEEMTPGDALQEKFRLSRREETPPFAGADALPEGLKDLIARTQSLHERIKRFDATLYDAPPPPPENAVAGQIAQLQAALNRLSS